MQDAVLPLSSGAYTDAFNSSVAPYSTQHNTTYGSIAIEGNVTLSGSATVGGTIFVPNTTVGTSCQVSGGKVNQGISSSGSATCASGKACTHQQLTTAAPGTPSVPTVTPSGNTTNIAGGTTTLNPSNYSNGNSANSINISGGANVTLPAGTYYIYNLTVSGGSTITLGQGTYYLNSINLSGGSSLYLAMSSGQEGPVTLNIAGAIQGTPINLSGGTIVNQTLVASNLEIFYAGTGGVTLSGGANAYFVVDAPNAAVTLSGSAAIYGALVGDTINDSGGAALHFDEALSQLSQSITFPNPGTQVYGVAPITLAATASSGLPITYSVVSGPASISGSTLTITGAGAVAVEADQAGNTSYLPAPSVQQTFTVNPAVLTVTANNLSRAYGVANPTLTYTLSGFVNGDTRASATSGTPSLSTTATVSSPVGSYPITPVVGTLAAASYTFTFANGSLTIGKAVLTVTANNAGMTYGGTLPAFTASYGGFVNGDTTSALTGTPSLTTTVTSASPAGAYSITAAQGTLSASNYSFVFVNGSLTINQSAQTITFSNPGTQTYPGPQIPLKATASSGLAVVYSVTSGPATVGGSTLTTTGAGTVTVESDQPGNANYAAAAPVRQSFAVQSAPPNSLVLSPSTAGPDAVSTAQTLTVVLKDGSGAAIAGTAVQFTVTGANSTTGSATTDATGTATFTYSGANSGTDTVQATAGVVTSNSATVSWFIPAPVANAGPAQTVFVAATVQLDGTGSTDQAGNLLTYSWSLISVPTGSAATLVNAPSPKPTFVADKVGNYTVQLIVNDGHDNSAPSTVAISTQDSAPVANAGPNQTLPMHTLVQLNGSGSTDVDGNPLTYAWSFVSIPANSQATLTNPTTVNPTFTTDERGTYVVQLVVNDGLLNSAPSTVTISDVNTAPVANAGPNQTVAIESTIQLNGSGSTDVDGDSLTYRWSILSAPAGSTAALSSTTIVNPTFVADVPGSFVVQLIVNDGTVDSTPVTVTISTQDTAPVANAGPAQTVAIGALVSLNGSGSADADGQTLTYQWSILSAPVGSTATLSSATAVSPIFTADLYGTYVVQLIVNDGYLNSSPSTVTISTNDSAPLANPGPAQTVTAGSTVNLTGAASSDADGQTLMYRWSMLSQPVGSAAVLSNAAAVNPSFVADVAGVYVAQLIVNDGILDSAPQTVMIIANAPEPAAGRQRGCRSDGVLSERRDSRGLR